MSIFVSEGTPVLLQTRAAFEGGGLEASLSLGLSYAALKDRTAGMFYLRAGSTVLGMLNIFGDARWQADALLSCSVEQRYPCLAIVEELPAGGRIETLAAGEGSGTLILDIEHLEV
jgi:hypothetical protein